jgi:hypothetical protein
MAHPAAQSLHQSTRLAAPIGARTWQLSKGRAMTLHARHATELQVQGGCVWVTLDGPHGGAPNNSGDVFLNAGSRLQVAAGRHLVIEAMDTASGNAAQLSWNRVVPAYGFLGVVGEVGALGAVRTFNALAILRGAALGALRGALAGARAARAASNASRAQGAMACGESIASSGAL